MFHTVAELLSILVAWGVFVIMWNTRNLIDNNYYKFIGIAYLFIGGIDLVHTLAYKGMNIFPEESSDLPTQLWISARYMESVSFLIAPFFIGKRFKIRPTLSVFTAVTILLYVSIFYRDIFPTCFIEGTGLTRFKIISEYIISLILFLSIISLTKKRHEIDSGVFRLLVISIGLTTISELFFTMYIHAYGIWNLVGHYLKLLSFYFIYKAMIEVGLTRPFDLLFRELKQNEESVKRSEEQYRLIINSFGDAIHVIDKEYRLMFANPALKELSKNLNSSAEIIGNNLFVVSPFVSKKVYDEYEEVFKTGKTLTTEENMRFGNREYYSETRKIPLFKNNKVSHIITVIRDITERKFVEEILKKNVDSLKEIVSIRSQELSNIQKELSDTKRLSDIGALAATVAHELRNPLAVIKMAVFNMNRKKKDNSLDTHLGNIEKKVFESDQIISNLLFYSRIKKPRYEKVNLYNILKDCIDTVKKRYLKYKVSVKINSKSVEKFYIDADPLQMTEVFTNILNNAFESFQDKKGIIDIKSVYAKDVVRLTFQDNGTGIESEELGKVFEPFFTLKSRGTGLGLTVSKQIIELHGGNINIDSSKGTGTAVAVELPVVNIYETK
jgi:PAS domain S-box-containing protein